MLQFALLPIFFSFGVLLRRTGRIPRNAATVLNAFIIHISLPALILQHIHGAKLDSAMALPIAMPWALFTFGVIFFLLAGRLCGWSRETIGALILTGALANTSFMGLPMIEAYYGNAQGELAIGIVIDQLGTYMVLSTVGIMTAVICSQGQFSALQTLKKIAMFPPFQALIVALLLRPVTYTPEVEMILARLGDTLMPLALISIGCQLRFAELGGKNGPLMIGLAFKLLLAPALVLLVLGEILGGSGRLLQVTVFESAMGPQIGGSIVALEHKLDRSLVILMIGIGIPLSFASLPLWHYLLQGV